MLQRHRKSQSTSALSVIADKDPPPPLPETAYRDREYEVGRGREKAKERDRRAKRLSQHPTLERLEEIGNVQTPDLLGLITPLRMSKDRERGGDESKGKRRDKSHRARSRGDGGSEDELRGWMSDVSGILSLISSSYVVYVD